ncbi:hypothetical protein EYD45_02495 [Hyunsoonleella flava]|uniref:SRPBCC family protein n=1 Tax=Hyunsoonleella flava TaxID=2527939 RepID=A0A4Q9FH26_9FLAO|nr:hypothetical protein [Hyunsoonleella flava]TBN06773.1 hypothetical protein EYD45_02495 [Hyunsoonleella flava]
MDITNIHKRIINAPKEKISPLLKTLATKHDKVWPHRHWPAIKFKDGLSVGSKGGHGIIKYVIEEYKEGDTITFRFLEPKGFDGIHRFDISILDKYKTEIKHSIIMQAKGTAAIQWVIAIRWLHDALIENAFDCIENNVSNTKTFTKWNVWVRLWRFIFKRLR